MALNNFMQFIKIDPGLMAVGKMMSLAYSSSLVRRYHFRRSTAVFRMVNTGIVSRRLSVTAGRLAHCNKRSLGTNLLAGPEERKRATLFTSLVFLGNLA